MSDNNIPEMVHNAGGIIRLSVVQTQYEASFEDCFNDNDKIDRTKVEEKVLNSVGNFDFANCFNKDTENSIFGKDSKIGKKREERRQRMKQELQKEEQEDKEWIRSGRAEQSSGNPHMQFGYSLTTVNRPPVLALTERAEELDPGAAAYLGLENAQQSASYGPAT